MIIEDLVGKYTLLGTNQDDSDNTYKGTLELTLNDYNRFDAVWLINNHQTQTGTGFFKNNILVINFTYEGDAQQMYRGVAVYKCISKNILEGFWSEDYGDPNFLGTERCFRIDPLNTGLN